VVTREVVLDRVTPAFLAREPEEAEGAA